MLMWKLLNNYNVKNLINNISNIMIIHTLYYNMCLLRHNVNNYDVTGGRWKAVDEGYGQADGSQPIGIEVCGNPRRMHESHRVANSFQVVFFFVNLIAGDLKLVELDCKCSSSSTPKTKYFRYLNWLPKNASFFFFKTILLLQL